MRSPDSTTHLLASPRNAERLRRAIAQARATEPRRPDWQEVHAGGAVMLGGLVMVAGGLVGLVGGLALALRGMVPRHLQPSRSTQQYVADALRKATDERR